MDEDRLVPASVRHVTTPLRQGGKSSVWATRWQRCRFQRSKNKQQLINLGWNSDRVNVHVDALWKAFTMKARSPVKVMEKMALCPATRRSREQHDRERANLDWFFLPLSLSSRLRCSFAR